MQRLRRFGILAIVVLALAAPSSAVAAGGHATRWVNDDGATSGSGQNCNKPGYNTIQTAVNAAASGDRIVVCEGTYVEQVTIAKSVQLVAQGNAIIQAPAVMSSSKAIVQVSGPGTDAGLDGFTISGPGSGGCDSLEYGVRVDGGAHATITDNHITMIEDTPFGGCQNGVAILVGRASQLTTGTATISGNTIDNYQKAGIVVDNVGSDATISDNTITGVGPTALIAQNGIQISRGATADVEHNELSGNVYTPGTDASTGMLLYLSGAVVIAHNTVSSNDVDIYAISVSGSTIEHNDLSGATFDGLDLTSGTTNTSVAHNSSHDNAYDGIFVDSSSTGNTLDHNDLSDNAEFDANDLSVGAGTAGTANTWEHTNCATSNPSGLCD
jgi:parallel beta-helix repeat protein